ncbi:PIN domain-containing protein [Moraxella nasovis]|uniref:PIN domain-containing protein n=1 Tax=Moraxella nasovis TaxID=2904121 RepID=UPI001F604993|nr:PIN domain-containing protein [Moraxella nasovis]UNU72931.1 PIN domain-containing protein [Moraxella nasovis]
MKKILLLDIENVQVKSHDIFLFCEKYHAVYISFVKTPAIFALQDINQLNKVLDKSLFLIPMRATKKANAADFGLGFYAGLLSQKFKPNKVKFHILSSDQDFCHIVDLLIDKGFVVKQISKEKYQAKKQIDEGILPKANSFNADIYLHDVHQMCVHWAAQNLANLPKKPKTLQNAIKIQTRLSDSSVHLIIDRLLTHQLITLIDNKIQYNLANIKTWSKLKLNEKKLDKDQLIMRHKELARLPDIKDIANQILLRRVKLCCDLWVDKHDRPTDRTQLFAWIQQKLALNHDYEINNTIQALQKCYIINAVGNLVFDDELIENWANVVLKSSSEQFVRVDNRLLSTFMAQKLKDELLCQVKVGQEAITEEYLVMAKVIFPNESDVVLMKLAASQGWVKMVDGKSVYAGGLVSKNLT